MLRASFSAAVGVALPALVLAQAAPIPEVVLPYAHDTGFASANGAAGQLQLVHQFTVQHPGAQSLRLFFEDVSFAGDVLAGNGAVLRLTGHRDGAVQRLDGITLQQWAKTSAYFNGDAVEVELLAYPGTGDSRVVLREIVVPGFDSDDSICGSTDDRLPSTDPRSARLLPIGCTGWLIDDCAGCFLTAGHCQGNINVVQFNVPPSSSSGSLNHPPPSDQYAWDPASLQGNGGSGVGDDWAYFGTFANSTTGLTARQAQGMGFVLVNPPPVGSANIRITGYGTDSSPPDRNQVQQTHVGPLVTSSGSTVQYRTDTTGGNSGSPVIWEQTGQAVGIHTHGGCSATGGQNSGTGMTHPDLQSALADPNGICSGGLSAPSALAVVAPAQPAPVTVTVSGDVVAGTVTLHHRASGGGLFQQVSMQPASGGVYVGTLPGFLCGDEPEYYFSAQFMNCGLLTSPPGGAATPLSFEVGQPAFTFEDDFENAQGWSATSAGATSGFWQRGVPVNDPGWAYDPSADGDGSGSAYLTQNQSGNTDVDNGSVTLLSPVFDRSSPTADIRYLYYLELTRENAEDALVVEVSDDGGSTWAQLRRHDDSVNWAADVITPSELLAVGIQPSANTRLRFTANDANTQSIVEAGVDGVQVGEIGCDPTVVGGSYCTATANSTGQPGTIRANGSRNVVDNDVTLTAESLPQNVLGYFLVSPAQAFVPNAGGSQGNLCVGLPLGRYAGNVLASGTQGSFALMIDLTAVPQPLGNVAVQPGETWNFQAWYRDSVLGFPSSNLTNGVTATFQ